MPQSPDIVPNSDGGISDFRISGPSLIKENCLNSRTTDVINMKLGPVNNRYKKNKTTSKNFDGDVMSKIVTSFSFFQFMANLEQSGSRIPGAWSMELTFSLTITFYLAKTENRTKKSLTQLSHYCFE